MCRRKTARRLVRRLAVRRPARKESHERTSSGSRGDLDIRETLVELLQDEGHDCSSAADGQQALDSLHAATLLPDLILLGLRMPVLDGAGFRAAQLRDPRLSKIPIVVLPANAQVRETAVQLGAAGHLHKPVNLDVLLDTVGKFAAG